ncbi:MAG: hypothetical protein GY749_04180 [Desulfobacteraceae bacterium]|nr:hypothetical protein [Desulfobacteraceae bacterium]
MNFPGVETTVLVKPVKTFQLYKAIFKSIAPHASAPAESSSAPISTLRWESGIRCVFFWQKIIL